MPGLFAGVAVSLGRPCANGGDDIELRVSTALKIAADVLLARTSQHSSTSAASGWEPRTGASIHCLQSETIKADHTIEDGFSLDTMAYQNKVRYFQAAEFSQGTLS